MRSEAVAESASLVGQCFAERYELFARVGSGAAGDTYRARHVEQPRDVAVKVFHDDVGDDAVRQRQFELEMSKLTALEHPNMPATLAFGVHGGRRFVVREWLEGETLAERLARGPISLEAAMTITRQILAALAAVHGAHLLHRDLHPNNVFLEARRYGGERVKLLDFAPIAAEKRLSTPFRPPEDAAGDTSDARSDVFAVGALMSAMLRPATSSAAGASEAGADGAAGTIVAETRAQGTTAANEAAAPTASANANTSDVRPPRSTHDAYAARGAMTAAVVAASAANGTSAGASSQLSTDATSHHGEQCSITTASAKSPTHAPVNDTAPPTAQFATPKRLTKAQRRREKRARRKSGSPGVPTKVQPNGHARIAVDAETGRTPSAALELHVAKPDASALASSTLNATSARAFEPAAPQTTLPPTALSPAALPPAAAPPTALSPAALSPSALPPAAAPPTAVLPTAGAPSVLRPFGPPTSPLVSAFETSFAPPALTPLEAPRTPAAEVENPLQRWIGRAMAADRAERFQDAADMLRELVDRLPRELRVAADESAKTLRATFELEASTTGESGNSDAERAAATAATAEAAAVLSPAKQPPRTMPRLTAAPVTHSNASDPLPEVDPVALHGPGEPGMSQLTAATAVGAFAFAAIVIIVMPGDLGRAHRVTTTHQALVAEPVAPARTETRVEAAKAPRPPSVVPLSAIAPVAPTPVSISPPRAAATAAAARPKPLSEARDPWLDPMPKELQRFRANAWSGSPGDKATIEALRVYNRANSKDARGYLIAARFYMNRLWRTDGIGQYAAAIERDPTVRGAPEILPALLECVAEGKAAPAAEALIEKVYGTGAVPAIDRALDKVKSQTTAVRLSTLSEKLLAKAP